MTLLLMVEDLPTKDVIEKFQESMAGEQSLSIYTSKFRQDGVIAVGDGSPRAPFVTQDALPGRWTGPEIHQAGLRFRSGRFDGHDPERAIKIDLYTQLSGYDVMDQSSANFAGTFGRRPNTEANIFTFDVTAAGQGTLFERANAAPSLSTCGMRRDPSPGSLPRLPCTSRTWTGVAPLWIIATPKEIHRLADVDEGPPPAVIATVKFLCDQRIWFLLSRNPVVRSCRKRPTIDVDSARSASLFDELKSFLATYGARTARAGLPPPRRSRSRCGSGWP